MYKKILLGLVFILMIPIAYAGYSGSGGGTAGNPYLITDCAELQEVGEFHTDYKYWRVANDIDCTGVEALNGGIGFAPIGFNLTEPNAYNWCGYFDGNDKTIHDVYINTTNNVTWKGIYTGLFSFIQDCNGEPDTIVKDMNLVDFDVRGTGVQGVLAGGAGKYYQDWSVKISNIKVYNSSMLVTDTYGSTGGLIGSANGKINFDNIEINNVTIEEGNYEVALVFGYCYDLDVNNVEAQGYIYANGTYPYSSDGNGIAGFCSYTGVYSANQVFINATIFLGHRTGKTGFDEIGGFMSSFSGDNITNSYVIANITSNGTLDDYGGGFIGRAYNGYLESNFAWVTMPQGDDYFGGFIGRNGATIENAYARGSITGDNYVGGFIGYNTDPVKNAYSLVSTTGNTNVGSFVGYNSDLINQSYANVSALNFAGTDIGTISNSTEHTESQLQNKSEYYGWDFITTWGQTLTLNNYYPVLLGHYPIGITPVVVKINSTKENTETPIQGWVQFDNYMFDNLTLAWQFYRNGNATNVSGKITDYVNGTLVNIANLTSDYLFPYDDIVLGAWASHDFTNTTWVNSSEIGIKINVQPCGGDYIYPVVNFSYYTDNGSVIDLQMTYNLFFYDGLGTYTATGLFSGDTNNTLCTDINPALSNKWDWEMYGTMTLSKDDYATRVYTIPQGDATIVSNDPWTNYSLFMIPLNESSTVSYTWLSTSYELIDGVMRVYRCNDDGTKSLVESVTISSGSSTANIELFTQPYSYEIVIDDNVYQDESFYACHLESQTEITYYVDTIVNTLNPVIGLLLVDCSLTNVSNVVTMTWDANELVTSSIEACIVGYRDQLGNQIEVYRNCSSSTSYSLSAEVPESSNAYYIKGEINQNGYTAYCSDVINFNTDNDFGDALGTTGIFAIVFLVMSFALFFAGDGELTLIGAVIGIVIAYILGITAFGWMITTGIIAFLILIAIVGKGVTNK